jgi:hypothetical protein
MANQFKTSIIAHITKLKNSYKVESDYWEAEHKANPKLKHPKEEYIRYHWEYRAYDMLLTNIEHGNYDSVEYYNNYLKPKTK